MHYYKMALGYTASEIEQPYEEITEKEYNEAIATVKRRAGYVRKLYNGEIPADEIPADIRETVIAEVEAIREAEKREEVIEPTAEEVLNILTGETA